MNPRKQGLNQSKYTHAPFALAELNQLAMPSELEGRQKSSTDKSPSERGIMSKIFW